MADSTLAKRDNSRERSETSSISVSGMGLMSDVSPKRVMSWLSAKMNNMMQRYAKLLRIQQ